MMIHPPLLTVRSLEFLGAVAEVGVRRNMILVVRWLPARIEQLRVFMMNCTVIERFLNSLSLHLGDRVVLRFVLLA